MKHEEIAQSTREFFESMQPASGDRITPLGFGTFIVGSRPQREGRNPRTGEKIKIPASKVVRFKAGKALSERVK